MKYEAVFFDFDGTLMDTSEGCFYSAAKAFDNIGIKMPEVVHWERFIGPPLPECFRQAFDIEDSDLIRRLCEAYMKIYEDSACNMAVFYPGIVDIIARLKENGVLVGIASLKNTFLIGKMLKHFKIDHLINGYFGLDREGKNTKADCLRDGFAKFGLEPGKCVLIGDSIMDVNGAAGAGCDCIRVNWGFGFKKGEPGTVSDCSELGRLIL